MNLKTKTEMAKANTYMYISDLYDILNKLQLTDVELRQRTVNMLHVTNSNMKNIKPRFLNIMGFQIDLHNEYRLYRRMNNALKKYINGVILHTQNIL